MHYISGTFHLVLNVVTVRYYTSRTTSRHAAKESFGNFFVAVNAILLKWWILTSEG